jgi:hypothetical protein
MSSRSAFVLALGCCALWTRVTHGEVILAESDGGWSFFSEGRVGAFASYVNGDAYPTGSPDANGNLVDLRGGGLAAYDASPEREEGSDEQGKVESVRVRSGFVGNVLGFGVRRQLSESTTVKGFVSIWAYIESEQRRKYRPVPADVREGYVKLEGDWGSFLAGRSLTLFSRGATQIDFLYGHGYGLGYPGSVDVNGPAAGHIGFGVLANGFAAGLVYATPRLAGLQLSAGIFDPSMLVGSWERTKWPRPEAELTFEQPFGELGKVVVFGNGGWQKVYLPNSTKDATAWGFGYGGRIEVGPVRLGLAGHYGQGLGLNYALESSDATVASLQQDYELRKSDGYYAQLQVVLGRVDVSAGAGMTRVHLLEGDVVDYRDDDGDPATPALNDDATPAVADPFQYSIIKQQVGLSAGAVYHHTDWLHFDVDYFRAQFSWYQGEKQAVNVLNAGATLTW